MVELVLEGAVFLTMGLQIKSIVTNVQQDHAGVGTAELIAVGALVLTVVVRAAYVAPLLGGLARRAHRGAAMQTKLQGMAQKLATPQGKQETFKEVAPGGRPASVRHLNQFARRITQTLADIDYFLLEPLGWREGTAVVWAGMRGAVTVAAAQTLPEDTPQRSVFILTAFAVAALSLLAQGGTIGPLLRRMTPNEDTAGPDEHETAERTRIMELMQTSAGAVPEPPRPMGKPSSEGFHLAKRHELAVIAAQRSAVLDARDNGIFDSDVLESALANLDASQIAPEMRGGPAG